MLVSMEGTATCNEHPVPFAFWFENSQSPYFGAMDIDLVLFFSIGLYNNEIKMNPIRVTDAST